MRCAIYIRVSTDEQANEGFSIPAQKERLRAFCKSQGWKIAGEYIEEGWSAKDLNRPQVQTLLKDIKTENIDIILVYRLDRLTRSVLDLYKLLDTFEKHGCHFKSATEIYDTSTASGRLFLTLIASLAQWERENLAERVKFGTRQMVEQGIRPGSPRPYGYDYKDGKLVVNKNEAKWVKWIFEKYISTGAETIAKELNQMGIRNKKGDHWSGSSIRYILDNPLYAGFLRWDYRGISGGKRVFNDEPILTELQQEDFKPIITKEVYEQTRSLLKERHKNKIRSTTHYPFSTILRCSECGHKYIGRTEIRQPGNRKYRSYSCSGRRKYGICNSSSFSEESMNEAFLNSLEYTLDQPDEIAADRDVDPVDLEQNIIKLQNKKERAKELYIEGDLSKNRYQELMDGYAQEEKKLLEIMNEADEQISTEAISEILENLKDEWNELNFENQKKAIHTLFESITVKVIKKGTAGKSPQPAVLEITD
ncbi:recombinase family protein, partial [Anaerobacillus sp. MEB173]|uniref:recombinase family protein n=1 Tax=Anaerobacillus sp. MEB173 TaxID=3383345 RepID=UPI003F8FA096